MQVSCRRKGQFTIQPSESKNRCGSETTTTFFYEARVTTDSSNLDAQGFVIDNADIHNYIVERYHESKDPGSCEAIAISIAQHFSAVLYNRSTIGNEKDEVKVMVTADPSMKVGITATINPDDIEWGEEPEPLVAAAPIAPPKPPSETWSVDDLAPAATAPQPPPAPRFPPYSRSSGGCA